MNPPTLRWGIMGSANIARKNWRAIQLAGNSTITAVASRDLERSRQFIAECQAEAPIEPAPRALGSYEALLTQGDVDAVYMPLPTGLRAEWVTRAAQAGKHVVCEKPCAGSLTDLRRMLEACESNHVQFMDGVMFMHSRRLEKLREVLDDDQCVGEVRRIASAFTFGQSAEFFAGNIRTHSDLEPYGCLGDLGWYCIRFALWVMGWTMPLEVTGRLLSEHHRAGSPAPVSTAFCGEMLFPGEVSADFYCSFLTEIEQWARISGTRGLLEVSDFVLPVAGSEVGFSTQHTRFQVQGCDFRMEDQRRNFTVPEPSHGHPDAQESRLFRNFARQVLSGILQPEWPRAALQTQSVMEACLESARAGGRRTRPT